MDRESKNKGYSSQDRQTKSSEAEQRLRKVTESEVLEGRMAQIKHKIMVLSGKGGVGKSTVAANVAVALAMEGKNVGLLDIDFHGPSIPTLLNLEGSRLAHDGESLLPIEFGEGLKVMSLGFLLNEPDEAVIWRGPMKMNVLKQLLSEVKWGDLDYLIMDFPPGTGDEPLSAAQLIPNSDGAIIVTTPQTLSTNDVRKSINFCRKVNVPVLGVIENMSGFVCPQCKSVVDIFKKGGGEAMAQEMGVDFLAKIPLDPLIVEASDNGKPFVYFQSEAPGAKAFDGIIEPLLSLAFEKLLPEDKVQKESVGQVRIAVPVTDGLLSSHFGHCDSFALFDVDSQSNEIINRQDIQPPAHEPGLLPAWLKENNADLIIAGGMGSRAQDLFTENGIRVVVGAPQNDPETVVKVYLEGTLETSDNLCDH